jgi:hypothetical protein
MPALPADLSSRAGTAEPGYYLVQFIGPAKTQWLEDLKQRGIHIIHYVPHHAFLVRAEARAVSQLADHPKVRWVGPYEPAFKLSQEVMTLTQSLSKATQTDLQSLVVSLFQNESLPETVKAIEALGGQFLDLDQWLEAAFAVGTLRMQPHLVLTIAKLPGVFFIEKYHPPVLVDEVSDQITVGNIQGTRVTAGYPEWLAANGLTGGEGLTIGVVDDGVDSTNVHLIGRVTDVLRNASPGSRNGHGTFVAATAAGQCPHRDTFGFSYALGVAPQARLINLPLDGLASFGGGNPASTIRDAVRNEARFINNSWSYEHSEGGLYTSSEWLYDRSVRSAVVINGAPTPAVIVFAAGNSGSASSSVGNPASAKNVITVGATLSYRVSNTGLGGNINNVAGFSSRGPTADGRIKPEVVAPGQNVTSTAPLIGGLPIDSLHTLANGTSFSAPTVTGTAALISEWWSQQNNSQLPSPAMIKALLINTAQDIRGSSFSNGARPIPNTDEGWGRVNLESLFTPGATRTFVDQDVILTEVGQQLQIRGTVVDPGKPVRITLVWTDPAALPSTGSNPALVNDLDLMVDAGGQIFWGNQFVAGLTVAGGGPDRVNNVENVFLSAGTSGEIVITITAAALNINRLTQSSNNPDQDFALVISNVARTP